MKILADRSFERDVKRLPGQAQQRLKGLLQEIAVATTLQDVNATKMEGAKNAYRIRFGDFRLGFYLEGNQVILSRVLDRKDIYKYFPKK